MSEPQPCGPIASATHCCEYHGIHSEDAAAARIAELEQQVLARDAQVLEDGRTIVDQRIKLDSARQILERMQHQRVQMDLSRRIDHWLASTTTSKEERLLHHLTATLAKAAVAWSAHEAKVERIDPGSELVMTPFLEALLERAHELRLAGEP